MKIAVFYTGELRTYETTVTYFKKNVLLNEDYHVFAVIQSNNDINYETILNNDIGDNLKSFINFDKNDETWIHIRENLLDKINIDEPWKNYLRRSGSMIEYYQMNLAYKLMNTYEKDNNIKYDYILRFRTDTVLKDHIYFDWINYHNEEIKNILYKIKTKYKLESIILREVLDCFMNVFYNEKRIDYNINIDNVITTDLYKLLNHKDENNFIHGLNNYIKSRMFIIALRVNVIYFMKRELMDVINILGINYGKYIYVNDAYWFNAECQLKQICLENNIDFFSSTSDLEDKSLYEYNESNYFNNNELIDNKFSFLIKRA